MFNNRQYETNIDSSSNLSHQILQIKKDLKENASLGLRNLALVYFNIQKMQYTIELREILLDFGDSYTELPIIDDLTADTLIQIYLELIKNSSENISSRAFNQFGHFLLNDENYPNNSIFADRFLYSKPNIEKLCLSTYLNNIEYRQLALDYCLFFLMNFEDSDIYDITSDGKQIESINWYEKRIRAKQIKNIIQSNKDYPIKNNNSMFMEKKVLNQIETLQQEIKDLKLTTRITQNLKHVRDVEDHNLILNSMISRIEALENNEKLVNYSNKMTFLEKKVIDLANEIKNISQELQILDDIQKGETNMVKNMKSIVDNVNNNIEYFHHKLTSSESDILKLNVELMSLTRFGEMMEQNIAVLSKVVHRAKSDQENDIRKIYEYCKSEIDAINRILYPMKSRTNAKDKNNNLNLNMLLENDRILKDTSMMNIGDQESLMYTITAIQDQNFQLTEKVERLLKLMTAKEQNQNEKSKLRRTFTNQYNPRALPFLKNEAIDTEQRIFDKKKYELEDPSNTFFRTEIYKEDLNLPKKQRNLSLPRNIRVSNANNSSFDRSNSLLSDEKVNTYNQPNKILEKKGEDNSNMNLSPIKNNPDNKQPNIGNLTQNREKADYEKKPSPTITVNAIPQKVNDMSNDPKRNEIPDVKTKTSNNPNNLEKSDVNKTEPDDKLQTKNSQNPMNQTLPLANQKSKLPQSKDQNLSKTEKTQPKEPLKLNSLKQTQPLTNLEKQPIHQNINPAILKNLPSLNPDDELLGEVSDAEEQFISDAPVKLNPISSQNGGK